MRLLRCRWLVLVVLVLVGASCTDGGDFPDEGDVSEEAFLAMPGAVEIESVFTKGHRITDIDGRARDYSSILSIEYEIDGATGHDVYDWYLAELSDSSWEFRTTGTLERGGEPDQCRNSQGYCGSFQAIGTETPGESMIISLELYLSNGVDDAGSPLGIAHIDDEIDGYRIRSLVEFAPAEQGAELTRFGGSLCCESPRIGVATVAEEDGEWVITYSVDDPLLTAVTDTTLVYQVCGETGLCSTATLTIQVIPVSACTITGTSGPDTLAGTDGDDAVPRFARL